MTAIAHPFIAESMDRFGRMAAEHRDKIHFIHLNHTNPALRRGSDARRTVESEGFHVADDQRHPCYLLQRIVPAHRS